MKIKRENDDVNKKLESMANKVKSLESIEKVEVV